MLSSVAKFFSIWGFSGSGFWGSIIGRLFYYVIPIRKKTVVKNLTIAFPEMTREEILSLAKANYISIAKTFVEIMVIRSLSPDEILHLYKIENPEILERHAKESKALICMTAHFGNWELGAISTGIYFKKGISVLVKPQSNPYTTEWMTSVRSFYGNKEIYTGVSVRELVKALKNKEVIGIVGDQRGPDDGMRINFFGQKTAAYSGTSFLAHKYDVPLLIMFFVRRPDGKFLVKVKEVEKENYSGNTEEASQKITQCYFSFLEECIKEFPDQWFWMHKIWKY